MVGDAGRRDDCADSARARYQGQDDQGDRPGSEGARLIGIYDSQVAFGQSQMLLVWTRLIMPNGCSIVLERQPGADTSGFFGREDEADNH